MYSRETRLARWPANPIVETAREPAGLGGLIVLELCALRSAWPQIHRLRLAGVTVRRGTWVLAIICQPPNQCVVLREAGYVGRRMCGCVAVSVAV